MITYPITGYEFPIYYGRDKKKYYLYDFLLRSKGIIIEYGSLKWHPRKELMTVDEWNSYKNPFNYELTAQELADKDEHKRLVAENNGYSLIEAWYERD